MSSRAQQGTCFCRSSAGDMRDPSRSLPERSRRARNDSIHSVAISAFQPPERYGLTLRKIRSALTRFPLTVALPDMVITSPSSLKLRTCSVPI